MHLDKRINRREMMRSLDGAKPFTEPGYPDFSGDPLGVHFGGARGVDQIDAQVCELLTVARHVAGIALEVLAGAELGGIDEDADDRAPAAPARCLDQRQLTGMKAAHGGEQGDGFAASSPGLHRNAKIANRGDADYCVGGHGALYSFRMLKC